MNKKIILILAIISLILICGCVQPNGQGEEGKTFTLSGLSVDKVLVTEAVPKYETGESVTDYNTAFETKTINVENGKTTITLGENPVFIELGSAYSKTVLTDYEDSPFGFHPATVVPPLEYGISNPYDYAIDIGIKWNRGLSLIWTLIQPDLTKDEYKLEQHDKLVKDTLDSIQIMANIYIGNPREDTRYYEYAKEESYLPKDEEAYKRFVKTIVERYDGDGINDMPGIHVPVKYWQVDNEPPHALKDYSEFLKVTYLAIKEADPEAKVIIGGVPGLGTPSSIPVYAERFSLHYFPLLSELAKLKGKYFDIFDFHWYGKATGDYRRVRDIHEYIKQKIDERGLSPTEGYWITEMGTYSGDPSPAKFLPDSYDPPFQTEKQQTIDLIKRYVCSLSIGIKKVFMAFGLKEGFKYDEGYFDFTGLIYNGKYNYDRGKGVKKLGYYTYKLMVEKLEGSDWDNVETIIDGRDNIYVYKFNRKDLGKPIYVA